MALDLALGVALVGVPLYDWMMVTGVAAKMPSFDYHYWPMSRWRIGTIALLAVGLFVSLLIMKPPESNGRLWIMLPAVIAVLIHAAIAIVDIFAQRRLAAERN